MVYCKEKNVQNISKIISDPPCLLQKTVANSLNFLQKTVVSKLPTTKTIISLSCLL